MDLIIVIAVVTVLTLVKDRHEIAEMIKHDKRWYYHGRDTRK